MYRTLLSLVVLVVIAAPVRAESELPAWHAGLNLRTELGTHPIRVEGGLPVAGLELNLVVDPMFWTDGQTDSDLWVAIPVRSAAVLAGWRTTTIPLLDSTQWHQKLLIGAGAGIEGLSNHWLRASWGVELATVVVKHGGDLPTDWVDFGKPSGYLDLVNFAMFVRFDYASL
ncbi:MAG: hypothetical protein KJO07_22155 [Deltaproteobacteria bacterium]|nr:hypothetical protein [Deltaproteobacteria bacterium]